jgi:hypothetical protein
MPQIEVGPDLSKRVGLSAFEQTVSIVAQYLMHDKLGLEPQAAKEAAISAVMYARLSV